LNIAVDASYTLDRNLTGVGAYSRHILFGLARQHPEQRFLFCYRPHRFFRSLKERLPQNGSRALLRTSGIAPWRADLFHALNQRIDRKPSRRAVSTFHDLFVLTDEFSPPDFRRRFAEQARNAAARSDLIIAVSQFTADQVCDLLRVDAGRIRVIHHGVTAPPFPPPADAERENIILHVGAIQKRKNIARLVEAFERVPEGWRLVLAGSAGFGAEEILARIEQSPKRNAIEWLGYVDAARLESLYARARVFAFPSLGEGFGIPVIEAMARGVPVIASSHAALREVGANAAMYVDPEDVDSIAHALLELIHSEAQRDAYRLAGFQRSAAFTWDYAIRRTWNVYRELV
jgi:glycosyltransferase involved in cell wall biosynthesis